MKNVSNITDDSMENYEDFLDRTALTCGLVFQNIFLAAGTFLNLWLLFSFLTSRDLRGRLRNQLICNLSISNLVQTLIKIPTFVALLVPFLYFDENVHNFDYFCRTLSALNMVEYVTDFLGNWLLVLLLTTTLAQTFDFSLKTKLTPQAVKICKVALHIIPWIVVAIATPVSITTLNTTGVCFLPLKYIPIFESMYTILPISLAILLTIIAFLLRYKRRGAGTNADSLVILMIGKESEMDNPFAYLVAVVICAGCEICSLILMFEHSKSEYRGLDFEIASLTLSDSRVILMVFPWLLFPDIRQRIRSWRPWKHEASGVELTIAYHMETYKNKSGLN